MVAVLACELVGVLGAVTTSTGSSPWYQALAKPAFQPPGWVFGPVWTLLYALMGAAAWSIWRRRDERPVGSALAWFGIQLALNAVWSPVFFGMHQIGLALAILIALVAALVVTIRSFAGIERTAAWMLAPYLLWSLFATVLNASILHLN